jgi:riboflavin biosynthesis pyrimidine reductase
MHLIWATAMSMDGRVADPNDSLDFLSTIGEGYQHADLFKQFLAGLDAVVIGATTMRWLLDGGHGWPHDDLPTWLVSHDAGLVERIGETRAPLVRVEGHLGPMFDEIDRAVEGRVWLCGGGDLAGQALALDRIDEVAVTVAPTALGAGASLFEATGLERRRFTLKEAYDGGGDAAVLTWLRER